MIDRMEEFSQAIATVFVLFGAMFAFWKFQVNSNSKLRDHCDDRISKSEYRYTSALKENTETLNELKELVRGLLTAVEVQGVGHANITERLNETIGWLKNVDNDVKKITERLVKVESHHN